MEDRKDPELAAALALVLEHAPPELDRPPVAWWRLITDAEELRARTGLGLAGLWGEIAAGDYPVARAHLDQLITEAGVG